MSRQRHEEEAALWLVRREGGDWSQADAAALDEWLSEAPSRQAAFWRLEKGWNEADRLAALGETATAPSRRRGPASLRLRFSPRAGRRLGWIIPLAVAACIAAAAALHVTLLSPVSAPVAYETPRGGSRELVLADGSRVEMNTATRLRAFAGVGPREVWLDQGEAFFDIAHRDGERFVVHAGPRRVTVLGTRFSVRREGDTVTVAVLQGQVRLDDAGSVDGRSSRPALIGRGDVAIGREADTLVSHAAPERVEAALAWRDGMVVFNRTPLSEAVAELNRYSAKPIRISDPALAQIRIGGSFRTANSAAFIRLLQDAYGLEVADSGDDVVVSE
nr:FecR domain-containing protein [uncultured Brevundimonas sp.]